MKPLNFLYKCQNNDIFKQYNFGCRCFDLRLYYDHRTTSWGFCHGIIRYKSKSRNMLKYILEFLNLQDEPTYVGINLEYIKCDYDLHIFKELCSQLESEYPNIKFFGGKYLKHDMLCYKFKTDVYDVTTWTYQDGLGLTAAENLVPYLFAVVNNHIYVTKCRDGINLFDFITSNTFNYG